MTQEHQLRFLLITGKFLNVLIFQIPLSKYRSRILGQQSFVIFFFHHPFFVTLNSEVVKVMITTVY